MSRWLRHPNDLDAVVAPANASKSREVADVPDSNQLATARAAALLNYQFHGNACQQCGNAGSESALCSIGQQLYAKMRQCGAVS